MKVKQLRIDSFRGIKNLILDFDLNEPTVIIGIIGFVLFELNFCLSPVKSQKM